MLDPSEIEPGIHLIDKPRGISSFDVIRRLRRELGVRKMGHAGTLDPQASGLMIVAVGPATKKLSAYIKLPKVYEADIILGLSTETGDLEGKVTNTASVSLEDLSEEKILETVAKMKGKLTLRVPAYSAVRVQGKRLYALARAGKNPTPPEKDMEITSIEVGRMWQEGTRIFLSLSLGVASGTYIRSIAEELGRRLGVPATLAALRRVSIGKWSIENARALQKAEVE